MLGGGRERDALSRAGGFQKCSGSFAVAASTVVVGEDVEEGAGEVVGYGDYFGVGGVEEFFLGEVDGFADEVDVGGVGGCGGGVLGDVGELDAVGVGEGSEGGVL